MVFSSPIFLFFFLPITVLVYFCLPRKAQNVYLLTMSLLFYAWGESVYVALMLLSIVFNHIACLCLDRLQGTSKKTLVAAIISLDLGLLAVFKYGNYIVDNLNLLLAPLGLAPLDVAPIHLPIGISFFTFQAISYVVDVYRGEQRPQQSLIDSGLYIAMFPQLIAGPIVRYGTISAQLASRVVDLESFSIGIRRFIIGLAKKVLIANQVALVADQIFDAPASELSLGLAWLGILCYALQIYFDFSGYSDMAIGLGRMFGFKFPENFNYPYVARSMQDFWRRWHISLSSWFRDYLYIPLGGNQKGAVRTYCNLWVVFILCGLWHGASWNFVVWGMLHGSFLVLERVGFGRWLSGLWWPLQHAYVALVVLVAWVFFRAETLPQALAYVATMFGLGNADTNGYIVAQTTPALYLALAVGIVWSTPFFKRLGRSIAGSLDSREGSGLAVVSYQVALDVALLGLFFLCAANIAAGSYNPFIYFRF